MTYDGNANDDWGVDEAALEAARLESNVFGKGGPNGEGETTKQTLRRLFRENSTTAALQIIKLAANASGERVRYDASKYIVERVLGPMVAGGGDNDDTEKGSLEHTLALMAQNLTSDDAP